MTDLVSEVGKRVLGKLLGKALDKAAEKGAEKFLGKLAKKFTEKIAEDFANAIGARGLEKLVSKLGEDGLEKLAEKLTLDGLGKLTEKHGVDAIVKVAETLGKDGFEKLTEEALIKQVEKAAKKIGADAFKASEEAAAKAAAAGGGGLFRRTVKAGVVTGGVTVGAVGGVVGVGKVRSWVHNYDNEKAENERAKAKGYRDVEKNRDIYDKLGGDPAHFLATLDAHEAASAAAAKEGKSAPDFKEFAAKAVDEQVRRAAMSPVGRFMDDAGGLFKGIGIPGWLIGGGGLGVIGALLGSLFPGGAIIGGLAGLVIGGVGGALMGRSGHTDTVSAPAGPAITVTERGDHPTLGKFITFHDSKDATKPVTVIIKDGQITHAWNGKHDRADVAADKAKLGTPVPIDSTIITAPDKITPDMLKPLENIRPAADKPGEGLAKVTSPAESMLVTDTVATLLPGTELRSPITPRPTDGSPAANPFLGATGGTGVA